MKRDVLWIIAALLGLGCAVSAMPSRAFACSPNAMPDFKTARSISDAVFIGRVVDVEDGPITNIVEKVASSGYKRVLLNVTQVWKGDVKSQVIVSITSKICGSYTYHFSKDKGLLVFADNGPIDSFGALRAWAAAEPEVTSDKMIAFEMDTEELGVSNAPREKADLVIWFYLQSYWREVAVVVIVVVTLWRMTRARRAG